MTTDPTWLPSTIMQTVGALFGIFMAVFILVIQAYSKHKSKFQKDQETYQSYLKFMNFFRLFFIFLAFLVGLTEVYNGILVYFLSDAIFEQFGLLLMISYLLFVSAVSSIICFSYFLIQNLIVLETEEDLKFSTPAINQLMSSFFYRVFNIISLICLCSAIFIHLVFKENDVPNFYYYILILYFLIGIVNALRKRKI